MKKMLVLMMIFGLVIGSIATAEAGKKKKAPKRTERVVELTYDHPSIGAAVMGVGGGYPIGFPDAPAEVPLAADEAFVQIEIVDDSGQKVFGYISQGDVNGDGLNNDLYGNFCGAHPEPIPLAAPGVAITGIYAFSGSCEDGSPSVMTTGTVKVTLSNLP